jgi:hypothetical protein
VEDGREIGERNWDLRTVSLGDLLTQTQASAKGVEMEQRAPSATRANVQSDGTELEVQGVYVRLTTEPKFVPSISY